MEYIANTLSNLWQQTAFTTMTPGNYAMICVAFLFLYLAIRWDFEPLLLVPISFGMLLVNIYPDIMLSIEDSSNGVGGLLYYFYMLDKWAILPSLIFMGVGAMTDFGPLIAAPRTFLLGAAAQVDHHDLVADAVHLDVGNAGGHDQTSCVGLVLHQTTYGEQGG